METHFGIVVVHFGDPLPTVALVEKLAGGPVARIVVINNGEPIVGDLAAAIGGAATVIVPESNLGFGQGANVGIEACVKAGIGDVVVLANDAVTEVQTLTELVEVGHRVGATVIAPRVLYDDGATVWADGISFSRTWGIAGNRSKGSSDLESTGPHPVDYVTGHAIALLGCGRRPWLRFDKAFFMYYEDVALCDQVRQMGGSVVLDDSIRVLHHKPGGSSYRFGETQQHHMAISGARYWKRCVTGWRRVPHLLGLVAITVYRLCRSEGLHAALAGISGLREGLSEDVTVPPASEAPSRILYVGPFPPLHGGIAQHGQKLVDEIRARDHEVSVVSWSQPYPRWLLPRSRLSEHLDPDIHRLRWWEPFGWLRTRRLANRADLVVFPWVSPFHALPLMVVTGGRRARRVVVVHNARPHEAFPLASWLTALALRHVSGVLAHSQAVSRELKTLLPDLEIEVIPHPANLEIVALPLPERPPTRLLFLGFVRRYKGLDLLLDALALLRKGGHDVTLTVAGEFWEDPIRYSRAAESLGISDAVELRVGYVADEEVSELIAAHHIVVAPYRRASQSGVVPLAVAGGRSLVVTPVGGLAEVLDPGYAGVATAVSASGIADAIIRVMMSGFPTSDLGAASWQHVVDRILRIAGTAGRSADRRERE